MKNSTSISKAFSLRIMAAGLLFLQTLYSFGQTNSQTGIRFSSIVTGSGFGTVYVPGFYVAKNNLIIEAGPMIQKNKLNFCGAHIGYEYTVFDGANQKNTEFGNEHLELFFSAQTNYLNDALLSKATIKREELVSRHKEIKPNFSELRFNALEIYAGFGLRYKINSSLKFSGSIGFGGWKTLAGERKLDRDYTNCGIALKSTLYVSLWQKHKVRLLGRSKF